METRSLNFLSPATAARATTQASDSPVDGSTASDMAQAFINTLHNHEATARAAMLGEADPHALVEALAASQMAIETVVTMRDKVVEAYQEILRMPV